MTIRNMLQNLRIRISTAARAFGQPTPRVFVVVDNWADELVSVHWTEPGAARAADDHCERFPTAARAGCGITELPVQP